MILYDQISIYAVGQRHSSRLNLDTTWYSRMKDEVDESVNQGTTIVQYSLFCHLPHK